MCIYSYRLVAGLEALCVCAVRQKVQTVLFTGFRKKSMLYWVSTVQVQIESI